MSIGPVDRVLHNRGGVSEATKERILKAIAELNYQPNMLASRLKSNKQYLLAILLPQATEEIPFWNEHTLGINEAQKEVKPFGISTKVLYFDQNSELSFREMVDEIIHEDVDAVLMVPVFYQESVRLVNHCVQQNIPCIFFDTNLPDQSNTSFIGQHAFESGYLAADLLHHCISPEASILIVNIVQEFDNHLHFTKREEGFRAFYEPLTSLPPSKLFKFESRQGITAMVEQDLREQIRSISNLKGIFSTNGIQHIARLVESLGMTDLKLIGYDLIPDNVKFLQNGVISFLISQQPRIQAYQGIKLLYQHLLLKQPLDKSYFLPIDIVMKSNLPYYTK